MTFSIDILREFLLTRHGILPERVTLETNFRTDLKMSVYDIEDMFDFVSIRCGIGLPPKAGQHFPDLFDLVIYIKLRQAEEHYEANLQVEKVEFLELIKVLSCQMP